MTASLLPEARRLNQHAGNCSWPKYVPGFFEARTLDWGIVRDVKVNFPRYRNVTLNKQLMQHGTRVADSSQDIGGGPMLIETDTTAPARGQQAQRQRRKLRAKPIEHLRLMVREHQVCYEIWPVCSTSESVRTQGGFELLLCGVDGHSIREGGAFHSVPCCQTCAHTYSELREIAEWVLHLKKRPSGQQIFSYDCALHLAPPHRHHRSEIVITSAVFQTNHTAGNERCESECLKEVRTRLSKLGIPEEVLPTPSGNA